MVNLISIHQKINPIYKTTELKSNEYVLNLVLCFNYFNDSQSVVRWLSAKWSVGRWVGGQWF